MVLVAQSPAFRRPLVMLLVGLFVVDALAAGVVFVRRRRHLRPHEVASGASYSRVRRRTAE